ncbi:Gfo/Idh/MocA family protein [Bacillus sp. FJAT-22090]|uniref:Gfo/Idh/MocA family protein n=1 Tax=Bacillus sp. FJAT-22090 TaxID=1581038 RepID=UPI0011A14939|nr:Gfo/Idh/MocA family oxidoreductase [Bacillus sp. FJAT-22090]
MQKIRWGIIGAANIAKQQVIPAIQQTSNAEIIAIASQSGKAKALATQFNIPNNYDTYEKLLDSPDIDAVYIALPNTHHKKWALAAIRSNKHVLCEKPIVLHATDLIELQQASIQHNVIFMEAFMYRFHPQMAKAKELLAQRAIGDILTIRSRFHFTIEDWQNDIRLNPDLGGGVLNDIGCYPLNAIHYLIEESPRTVQASQGKTNHQVDTHIAVQLSYPSGILAQIDASFHGPMTQTIDIIGTNGTMHLSYAFRTDLNNHEGIIQYVSNNETKTLTITANAYVEQIKAFHEAIENNEQPIYTETQMLQQTAELEKINEAIKTATQTQQSAIRS